MSLAINDDSHGAQCRPHCRNATPSESESRVPLAAVFSAEARYVGIDPFTAHATDILLYRSNAKDILV
jgi:hypothetical protein